MYLVIVRDIIPHSFTVTLQHGEARSQLKNFAKTKTASDSFHRRPPSQLQLVTNLERLIQWPPFKLLQQRIFSSLPTPQMP